ncbi:MAG: c-type cytochrome [Candidatus Obscuribacterales bacterium]|jgi:mono/diheme cytochrome c family protein|nr:c-type cytochrome [Candidatus Obscuribacterales bacterium]
MMCSGKLQTIYFAICTIFVLCLATACSENKPEYSSGSSFAGSNQAKVVIVYPMKNPSITEGRQLWEKLNCASCHGEDGKSTNGKSKVDLSSEFFIYRETPIRVYKMLAYELPKQGHPEIKESPERLWDLIFYARSLACPPFTEAQLAQMKPFFSANCSACHGPEGYGDGPRATALNPRPANFHQYNRLFDRQDFMLFNHIANGLFPSAMPAWRGYSDPNLKVDVNDKYIKKLVEYVRHFAVDSGDKPLKWWDEKENSAAPILDPALLQQDQCCPNPAEDAKGAKRSAETSLKSKAPEAPRASETDSGAN